MYWPSCYTLVACCVYKRIEKPEAIDLRLEVIVEHCLECRHLWIHNHYVAGYAGLSQCDALIGYSHCKIIYSMVLKSLCHLDSSCSVGVGLNHTHKFCLRFHECPIMVEIVYKGIKINL